MLDANQVSGDVNINQVGIVVRDLRAMIEQLNQLFGIGPFRVMEWPIDGIDPESTYHGKPANFRLLLAFATIGQTQLEIVEPLEGQNIFSDFLESHGPGLHHIRFTVPDFEDRVSFMEAAGIEKIASGTGVHVGSKWAYFDTTDLLGGVVVELRTKLEDADGDGHWVTGGIKTD